MNRNLQSIFAVIFLQLFFSANLTAQLPSYVPQDGLAGFWPFSGNAEDASGNGLNGVVNGSVLTEDRNGTSGAAYYFDGSSYIEVPNDFLFNQGEVSISAWVKADSYTDGTGQRMIVSKRESSGWGNGFQFALDQVNGVNGFHADWSIGNNGGIYYSDINMLEFDWYHLVYTHSQTTIKLYLNGVLVQEEASPGYISANELPVHFGQRPGGQHPFLGVIDDIGIWTRALTDDEVQDLYFTCFIPDNFVVGNISPLNFTTSEYTCNDNPGSTFNWTVTNGVISSGQGTNSIVVLWGNEGVGTVSVVETNSEGCTGQPAVIEVNVSCTSNISQISGNGQPIILQSQTYTVNGPVDSQYQWTVTNGVIASGQGTNSVNVIWAAEGEGILTVVETTATGCESPAVTFTANAVITNISELSKNHIILYPNPSSDLITIECDAMLVGEAYQIFDALGQLQQEGRLTNQKNTITLNTLAAGNYFLKVGSEVLRVSVGGNARSTNKD